MTGVSARTSAQMKPSNTKPVANFMEILEMGKRAEATQPGCVRSRANLSVERAPPNANVQRIGRHEGTWPMRCFNRSLCGRSNSKTNPQRSYRLWGVGDIG